MGIKCFILQIKFHQPWNTAKSTANTKNFLKRSRSSDCMMQLYSSFFLRPKSLCRKDCFPSSGTAWRLYPCCPPLVSSMCLFLGSVPVKKCWSEYTRNVIACGEDWTKRRPWDLAAPTLGRLGDRRGWDEGSCWQETLLSRPEECALNRLLCTAGNTEIIIMHHTTFGSKAISSYKGGQTLYVTVILTVASVHKWYNNT